MRAAIFIAGSLAAPAFAATKAPDATAPLRRFLAQKSDLKLHNESAGAFSFSSGAWHDTNWSQRARVFSPRRNLFPGTATMLLLTSPAPWDGVGGQLAADATGTTVIMVHDVPNQPLWNRRENALLGYSIQKSAQSGDATWALPFPMARAVVRSMDAAQKWSARTPNPLRKFVLVGFSKRALAAWLAAPDPRVRALVSLSYNNLNLEAQAKLQRRNWGQLSTHWTQMVGTDFEAKLQTSQGQKLTATWDPFSFREQIRVPKLLVDATNNDYWSLDAPDAFASELRGPTNWLFFANSGHTMEGAVPTLLQTSALWIRRTLEQKPLENPRLNIGAKQFELRAPASSGAVLNVAWSQNRDFRRASWTAIPMKRGQSLWSAPRSKAPASARFVAVFGAASYPNPDGAGTLQLSSRVSIAEVAAR